MTTHETSSDTIAIGSGGMSVDKVGKAPDLPLAQEPPMPEQRPAFPASPQSPGPANPHASPASPQSPGPGNLHAPSGSGESRGNELVAGVGHTLFEFDGSAGSEGHSTPGSAPSFVGNVGGPGVGGQGLDLSSSSRENNLGSGKGGMIIGGLTVALTGGLLAFFLLGKNAEAEDEKPAEETQAEVKKEEPAAKIEEAAGGQAKVEEGGDPAKVEDKPVEGGAIADSGKQPENGDSKAKDAKPEAKAEPVVEPKKPSSSKKTRKKKKKKKRGGLSPGRPSRGGGLDRLPKPPS